MGWREERDEFGLGTDHAALTLLTKLGPHVFEIVIALDALLTLSISDDDIWGEKGPKFESLIKSFIHIYIYT